MMVHLARVRTMFGMTNSSPLSSLSLRLPNATSYRSKGEMKFPYSDPSDIYLIELDAVVSWLVRYRGLQKNCALWLFYLPITDILQGQRRAFNSFTLNLFAYTPRICVLGILDGAHLLAATNAFRPGLAVVSFTFSPRRA